MEQLQLVSNAIISSSPQLKKKNGTHYNIKDWINKIPWFARKGNRIFTPNVNIFSNSSLGTISGTLVSSNTLKCSRAHYQSAANYFGLHFFWKNHPIQKIYNFTDIEVIISSHSSGKSLLLHRKAHCCEIRK